MWSIGWCGVVCPIALGGVWGWVVAAGRGSRGARGLGVLGCGVTRWVAWVDVQRGLDGVPSSMGGILGVGWRCCQVGFTGGGWRV